MFNIVKLLPLVCLLSCASLLSPTYSANVNLDEITVAVNEVAKVSEECGWKPAKDFQDVINAMWLRVDIQANKGLGLHVNHGKMHGNWTVTDLKHLKLQLLSAVYFWSDLNCSKIATCDSCEEQLSCSVTDEFLCVLKFAYKDVR